MPEDYMVKSGAKDMIANAIAEVLTFRPRVPVAFLASHFQGLATNKSAAVVSYLRACHPCSPSFPSAVEKAFYDLAAIEATPPAALSTNAPHPRSNSAGPTPSRKLRAGGPTTISEASLRQLLQQLSTDFPKHLQTKLLDAVLCVSPTSSSQEPSSSQGVGLTHFHRGVRACLLFEELIDAATLLFQGLQPDNSNPAEVSFGTLMNALQSATSHFSREQTAELIPLLSRSSASRTTSQATKAIETSPPTSRHLLQLNDVSSLFFDLVFEQTT
ncbi:hypothetical protein GN244_ATG11014 [Phytophthora infestans]|uniref:Uncharacterized protein n=1 Tax=Phytophthora infestans TaxID=4787 RepID=A0A833SPR5_PHYIN|nr:hypothetical protein GN244_ATG11014 [Phytophthora infestans]KAF4128357.1 hypothetical protein GN958_ATG22435 [Phytophthora infestans]